MRVVIQRVLRAQVTVDGQVVGRIGQGLFVLVGICRGDGDRQIEFLADKIANLRIFADEADKMNRSVSDVAGGVLIVSQFTLYGDARKGRRPSFVDAAPPEIAIPIYERFVAAANHRPRRAEGRFAAMMQIESVADGPVTILLESPPDQAASAKPI